MDPAIVNALFALGGTALGGLIGVVAPIVTARINARNQRAKLAADIGFRQWERLIEHARASGGGTILPAVAHIHFASRLVTLIEKGSLNAESYGALQREQDAFENLIMEHPDNRKRPVVGKGGA